MIKITQGMVDWVMAICTKKKWRVDPITRGGYLHLEVSELIESIRGKGGSYKEEECADVLIVLMSIIGSAKIDMLKVSHWINHKLTQLEKDKIGRKGDK